MPWSRVYQKHNRAGSTAAKTPPLTPTLVEGAEEEEAGGVGDLRGWDDHEVECADDGDATVGMGRKGGGFPQRKPLLLNKTLPQQSGRRNRGDVQSGWQLNRRAGNSEQVNFF